MAASVSAILAASAGHCLSCARFFHACGRLSNQIIPANVPQYVDVVIEVPRGSLLKRRPDGSVDYVTPFPYPFNYGSVPSVIAPDGDPLDAIVLGNVLPYKHRGTWRVKGMIKFTDAGLVDNKMVCVQPCWKEKTCQSGGFLKVLGNMTQTAELGIKDMEHRLSEDLSLSDWLLLSFIFSGYSIMKGALNATRGKHGPTSFDGWEPSDFKS